MNALSLKRFGAETWAEAQVPLSCHSKVVHTVCAGVEVFTSRISLYFIRVLLDAVNCPA